MIVFRCLFCNLGNLCVEVLRCPQCGDERFVAEYNTQAEPESPLAFGIAQTINFNDEQFKSTAETKIEVSSNSASLSEYSESSEAGFTLSYGDYTHESKRTNIEFVSSENSDPTYFSGSYIRMEQVQHSRKFSQYPIANERLSPEAESTLFYGPSLNIQDNHSYNPSNFDFLPNLLSVESQHLINFLHGPPCNEGNSQSFKKMIQKHKTTESTQIENDCKIDFSDSPYFEPQTTMLQSYPEITERNLMVPLNVDTNHSLDLLSKIGNYPNRNIQSEDLGSKNKVSQQEAHCFNHPKSMKGCEKAFALPVDCSSPKIFRCRKCPRFFRTESVFDAHLQNNCHPKPFNCHSCSKKFSGSRQLKLHQVVHTVVKPFKCEQCPFSTERKRNLNRHIKRRHKNNLVCCKSP